MKASDWVVHPTHGVGRVVDLEVREFGAGPGQMYYRIAIHSGTLWVPVEGPPSGLRKLTAKRELARYRGVLRSRPTTLAADHRERRTDLLERLKDSSFETKCEVVRDLTAFGWHRPLNESSALLLRTTRDELLAEWAAAEEQSVAEAAREVDSLLLEGRKAHDK